MIFILKIIFVFLPVTAVLKAKVNIICTYCSENTIGLFLWSDENYIDFATTGFLLISCQHSRALHLLLCSNPISP